MHELGYVLLHVIGFSPFSIYIKGKEAGIDKNVEAVRLPWPVVSLQMTKKILAL